MITVSRFDVAGKLTHQAEVTTIEAARAFLDKLDSIVTVKEPIGATDLVDTVDVRAKARRKAIAAKGVAARARNRSLGV